MIYEEPDFQKKLFKLDCRADHLLEYGYSKFYKDMHMTTANGAFRHTSERMTGDAIDRVIAKLRDILPYQRDGEIEPSWEPKREIQEMVGFLVRCTAWCRKTGKSITFTYG